MDGASPTREAAIETRKYYAELLCLALADARPEDVDQIVAAWLADRLTGGPDHDAFGTIKRDAVWWSETAPQVEVQEYAHAAMKRLGDRCLGRSTRLRLLAQLWNGLSPEDKAAFLNRVGGAP